MWKIRARINNEEEGAGVWLSIGDLMSVLLLVFALLFVVAELRIAERIEQTQQARIIIIKALLERLKDQGIHVDINEATGDVSLTESILFPFDSAELKPEGKEFLKRFVPIYSEVIFSDPRIEREVVRIIVEGHTSSTGPYGHNMDLSVARAMSVVHAIETMDFPYKDAFLKKLTPAGRGENDAQQAFDDPRDRKVIFRFQFRGEEIFAMVKSFAEALGLSLGENSNDHP